MTKLTDGQKSKIETLCKKGKTIAEIAEAVGASQGQVRYTLKANGYVPNHRGRGSVWS